MQPEYFDTIYATGSLLALENKYKSTQELGSRLVTFNGKNYLVFDNKQAFLQHLTSISVEDRIYHEVIFDVPQKLKFDIDATHDKFTLPPPPQSAALPQSAEVDLLEELFADPDSTPACGAETESLPIAYNDIFVTIVKAIRDAFFIHYQQELDPADEIITSSHGKSKFSNHIIINKWYVSGAAQAREFTRTVASFLPVYYRKFLDLGVNKRLQNFRAPGCYKRDEATDSNMRIKTIRSNHTAEDALITNVSGCTLLPDIAESIQRTINPEESSEIINICKREPEIAANHIYRHQRRGEFLFNRMRPSYCEFCDRRHTADNTLYVTATEVTAGRLQVRMYCRKYTDEHTEAHFKVLGEIGALTLTDQPQTAPNITTYCDKLCEKTIRDLSAGKLSPPRLLFDDLANKIVYNEPALRPFELANILIVRAQMKMGKTKALSAYIDKHFSGGLTAPVIRFVSFRQTFSNNIKEKFPDFQLYSDVRGPLSADRLIVQVESLHRIVVDGDRPDLLVLDECESIFEQFDSGLLGSNFNECFAVFQYLIRYSAHIVCMDANISDRTYRILEKIRADVSGAVYHHNQWQNSRDDHYFVGGDKLRWLGAMYSALENGEKIALCSNSLTEAKVIRAAIAKKYPAKTIQMYSSETQESEKREHFTDVNSHWLVDVLIYTPTVSAGVSFEQKHFDRIFGYFTDQSCCVETCQQMLGRVRDVRERKYHICFSASGNNLPTDPATIEESLHNKRDRLAQRVQDSGLHFEFGPAGEIIHHSGDYFRIWVENTRVRNLSKNAFVRRFITMIHWTGATIAMQDHIECDTEQIRAAHMATREEIKESHARAVASSPELDPEQVRDVELSMMSRQDIPDETRHAYEKYRLRRDYQYDGVVDAPFVMKYHHKSVRRTYKNICRLKTYSTMETAWEQIQAEEHSAHKYLMAGDESDQNLDLRRRYVFDQHRYACGLLKMMGWNSIDDPAYIHKLVLEDNFRKGNFSAIITQACREFEIKNKPCATADDCLKQTNKILTVMYGIIVTSRKSSPEIYYLRHNTMFTTDPQTSIAKRRPLIGNRKLAADFSDTVAVSVAPAISADDEFDQIMSLI